MLHPRQGSDSLRVFGDETHADNPRVQHASPDPSSVVGFDEAYRDKNDEPKGKKRQSWGNLPTSTIVFVNHALCKRLAQQVALQTRGGNREPNAALFQRVAQHGSDAQGFGGDAPINGLSDGYRFGSATTDLRAPSMEADQRRVEVERVRDLEEEEHKRRLEEIQRANESVRPSLMSAASKETRSRRSKMRALQTVLARRKYRRMQVDIASKCFHEFRQENTRNLKLSHFLFAPKPTAIFCSLWGLVILAVGIAILVTSQKRRSIIVEYSSSQEQSMELRMSVKEKLDAPVFVYYKIENFFGNAKQYLRDGPQHITANQNCAKIRSQKDVLDMRTINHRQTLPWLERDIFTGSPIPENQARTYPCGLQSASIFNDEFTLVDSESKDIAIREDELSVEWKFLQYVELIEEFKGILPWMATGSPRYRVWSDASFTPEFLKLYGTISSDLDPGTYKLTFSETGWPAEAWEARKAIVFMSLTVFGSSNITLAWIVIGTGTACIALSVVLMTFVFFQIRFPGTTVRQTVLDKSPSTMDVTRRPTAGEGFVTAAPRQPEHTATKLNYIPEAAQPGFACVCPLHVKEERRTSSLSGTFQSATENEASLHPVSRNDEVLFEEAAPDALQSFERGESFRDADLASDGGSEKSEEPLAWNNEPSQGGDSERREALHEPGLESGSGDADERESGISLPTCYVIADPSDDGGADAYVTNPEDIAAPEELDHNGDASPIRKRYLSVPSVNNF